MSAREDKLREQRNAAYEALEQLIEETQACELCSHALPEGGCRLVKEDPDQPCTPVWVGRRKKVAE